MDGEEALGNWSGYGVVRRRAKRALVGVVIVGVVANLLNQCKPKVVVSFY